MEGRDVAAVELSGLGDVELDGELIERRIVGELLEVEAVPLVDGNRMVMIVGGANLRSQA